MLKKKIIINHILFLFITLFLGNLISILLFYDLTTFYHDNLDGLIVYNKILGEFYSGNKISSKIFLNGELEIFYLRHFLKPFILIYSIFNVEFAYFFSEFLVKLTAYFSFFLFAKKFSKNIAVVCICSALFASSLPFTTLGFGLAIMPYVLYLVHFKEKLKIKHLILIIFFGLNTDLVAEFFLIPIIISIIFIIDKKIFFTKAKKIFVILTIFFCSTLLTSLNLIYIQLFEPSTHRVEFFSETLPFFEIIKSSLLSFFHISFKADWVTIKNFPNQIITFLAIIFLFLIRDNLSKKILSLIIFLYLLSTIFSLTLGDLYGIRLSWVNIYQPSLFIFLIFFMCIGDTNKKKRNLTYLIFIPLILFQINSNIVPFTKKNIYKIKDYRNIYTFNDYYMVDDYLKIRKIVQKNRVATIGYDPLIAAFNGLPVIDGYHALYPLEYKKKFYKIINDELNKNKELNSYYQNWGSRVYLFINDENNIEIDFFEAKMVGAKYIISKYKLNSLNLNLIKNNFKRKIFLYEIK